MNNYKYYIIPFALFLSLVGFSQKLTTKLSTATIAPGRAFRVTFEADGQIANFKAPDFSGFDVLAGPSYSSSTSSVNGVYSYSASYTYQLRAQKEGILPIKAATAVVEGKKVQSNMVSIQVIKGHQPKQKSQDEVIQDQISKNLFLVTNITKNRCYAGEPLVLEYNVFFNVNLDKFDMLDQLELRGFYTKDLLKEIRVTQGKYKGRVMQKATLRKFLLIPQKSGKIKIPSIEFEFDVQVRTRSNRRDIFADFFQSTKSVKYYSKSKTINLEVEAPPKKNQPLNYSGAVGKYNINASISTDKTNVNEAITLKIDLKGGNNLKLVEFPKPDFPGDIEVYDPKVKESLKMDDNGSYGTKSYEYLLIPRFAGTYRLNKLAFNYFDPKKKKYITLNTPEFNIEVQGEATAIKPTNSTTIPLSSKDQVDLINSDIRYIQTGPVKLSSAKAPYFRSALFYFLLTLVPVLMIILFAWIKIRSNKPVNHATQRKKNARKAAQKYLVEARISIDNKNDFYEQLSKALYGYASDKFALPTSQLNKADLKTALETAQIKEQFASEFVSIIEQCDIARYAPSSGVVPKVILSQAESIIEKIENA